MAAHQAPPSLGFSRQEHWSGLPFPSLSQGIKDQLIRVYLKDIQHHLKLFVFIWLDDSAIVRASQVVPVVKNLPANAGDVRDMGSIPGSERSTGGKNGNPLQYSCLENPMDRIAWATVHKVSKSWTWQKWLDMHTRMSSIRETYLSTHLISISIFLSIYHFI